MLSIRTQCHRSKVQTEPLSYDGPHASNEFGIRVEALV